MQQAALPTSPEVEACDRAAASPSDPDKPASIPGIDVKSISGPAAVMAAARQRMRRMRRAVFFQLGRAYASSVTIEMLSSAISRLRRWIIWWRCIISASCI